MLSNILNFVCMFSLENEVNKIICQKKYEVKKKDFEYFLCFYLIQNFWPKSEELNNLLSKHFKTVHLSHQKKSKSLEIYHEICLCLTCWFFIFSMFAMFLSILARTSKSGSINLKKHPRTCSASSTSFQSIWKRTKRFCQWFSSLLKLKNVEESEIDKIQKSWKFLLWKLTKSISRSKAMNANNFEWEKTRIRNGKVFRHRRLFVKRRNKLSISVLSKLTGKKLWWIRKLWFNWSNFFSFVKFVNA